MKRLKSLGSGKSKAKAEAAAKAANDHRTSPWPTVTPTPEEHAAPVPRHSHTQPTATTADTYVNFSDDEIRAMEESALEYAIQQSQQASGSPSDDLQRQNDSQLPAEPQQLQPQLPQPPKQAQPHLPLPANAQPVPETKQKGMSRLKERLGLKKQGSKPLTAASSSPDPSNLYPMAAGGHHLRNPMAHGQLLTSDPTAAQAGQGLSLGDAAQAGSGDMQEGRLGMMAQQSGRLSVQQSAGQQEAEEQAMMELAIKESEVQAEYDHVLREAKLLRLDFQHALTNCVERKVKTQEEHSELSELMGDFGLENAKGKGVAADHAIEQQFAQSEHDLQQANERVTAVSDAIRELQHLEDFIRSTKPPREEAVMLTEEIVRQLLEKTNFLRLDFPVQSAPKPVPRHESADIVSRFRQRQAGPLAPATPPRPSSAALQPPSTMPVQEVLQQGEQLQTSGAASSNPLEDTEAPGPSSAASSSSEMHQPSPNLQPQADSNPHQIPAQDELFTPASTPRPEAVTTPAATAAPLVPRSPSVSSVPSPRVLTHVDSHSSTDSAAASSLAIKQSKDQSRQLLEKASLKLASLLVNANDKNHDASRRPGEAAVRRAPQVVHLYQELRKLMGDDFMVRDLSRQDPAVSMLRGKRPFQALTAADEQARQRSLAQDPAALQAAHSDADKHARLLTKLGTQIRSVKLRSMEDLVSFVQEAEQQLSILKADEGLTVAQLDSWPKQRLDVLREAAGQFQELNYLNVKYQKWMLQQGTCLEEAARIEEFFDTARARVEWLANRQEVTERRFVNHGVPWDRSLFKTTRHMSLHLGVIYMSRILFEVANLERDTALKNEACLLHLADAVRVAYKAHQFAGGFNVDSAELFGKVKRLSQYYMRSMDPTWLKDTTKFSNSNGQQWDHVQRR